MFCGMHYFMIFTCDIEYQFNDDTNERHHLLFYYKELEQLKSIWAWKAAAIKVTTKYKKQNQIIIEKKEKQ